MISPEEISKRAVRKYRDVLRAYLTGDSLFPLEFPVGRLPKNLAERRQQIDALRERAKETTGQGYQIEWESVSRRDLGQQTEPRRIIIQTRADYLTVVRKRTEFEQFTADVERIRRRCSALETWLCTNSQAVIEYSGKWDDLLTVCDYFTHNPRPGVYIRELPIPVHTKFIEQHSKILRDLLDALLPPAMVNAEATGFSQRFGLKESPTTIRVRLLDEQLDWQYELQLDDLSLPVDQLAHLLADHIRPRYVIIAENQINFLTLPPYPESVGLFGSGFAVGLLASVDWLKQCQIIYWGDIDTHGFQILSDLRKLFPQVRSVMMDQQTLADYGAYVVTGSSVRADRFDRLTEAESALARHVLAHNLRLEQEHIPHDYALTRLLGALRGPM